MDKLKGLAKTKPAPARVWVLLASEAPKAVIFRRGPSRWTRLYLWDTVKDDIISGSWFAGRLYEWLSDLSPDGQHLLYCARNESKRRQQEAQEKFGAKFFVTWTALSRPHWVKAIGLWNASDGWSGGGAFVSNTQLVLNHLDKDLNAEIEPQGFQIQGQRERGRFSVVLKSLERTGWRITDAPQELIQPQKTYVVTLRKKALELKFIHPWAAKTYVTYSLVGRQDLDLSGVSWADFDQQGRLIFAKAGQLMCINHGEIRLLKDFNLDRPNTIGKLKAN